MINNLKINLIAAFIIAGLLVSGCSNFNLNLPFFSNHKVPDNPPRAIFIQKKQIPVENFKKVKIKAPLNLTINIVQEAIKATIDTTSFIVKTNADTSVTPNTIKIRSESQSYKEIKKVEEYFYVGKYVIHAPGYDIRPQGVEYFVEVNIKSGLGGYIIEPRSYALVDWNLFEYNLNEGDTVKIPPEAEKYYGIGSYTYEVEETYINANGKEKSFTYWEKEQIDDKPKSNGILEERLRNKLIEYAALNDVNASTNKL